MPEPVVTVRLPPEVYDELSQRARAHQRSVEAEAALAISAAIGAGSGLPEDLATAIAALGSLDDETLWLVSESQPTVEDGVLLTGLSHKRRRHGLTAADEQLLADLVDRHDRVMVLRAEAIALLKARGQDVSARLARPRSGMVMALLPRGQQHPTRY